MLLHLLLFWVMWDVCRMMYAEVNFSGGVDFQSDPSSVSYVQKSSSLELDTTNHQCGPLKNRFVTPILPPSALVSKTMLPYLVQDLIRDPFSAKGENKHNWPPIVPRFQLSTERSHGPMAILFCPTLFLQLFYYRSCFPLNYWYLFV